MIGHKVRALREARSWTQAHLAGAAELSLRTVQRLESTHSCSPETLLALAAVFDVEAQSLMDKEPLVPDEPQRRWWPHWAPSRAAALGGALAAPCFMFVLVNILKYGAGIPAPYDWLAQAGYGVGVAPLFETISPVLLLLAPALAFLINALVQVRLVAGWSSGALSITSVEIRPRAANLAVGIFSLACLAMPCAYLISETIGHIARGAV